MSGVQLPLPIGDDDQSTAEHEKVVRDLIKAHSVEGLIEAVLAAESPDILPRLAETIRQSGLEAKIVDPLAELVHPRARRPTLGGLWRARYTTTERDNALRMIRLLHQPANVEPIIAAIWDRDAKIRVSATNTLSKIGLWLDWSSPGMQHLIHALQIALRHRYPDVRRLSALALARLSAWEASEALADRLEVEKDPDVRQAVALALGSLSKAEAVFPLLDAYEEGEITEYVCLESLMAMGRDAVDPLISVVRRWNVRFTSREIAAQALGELHATEAAEPLIIILGRPHEPVEMRMSAAVALGKLGQKEALPMLHWVSREWGLEESLQAALIEAIHRIQPPPQLPSDSIPPELSPDL